MNHIKSIALAVSLLGCSAASMALAQDSRYGSAPGSYNYYNASWYVAPSVISMDPDSRFGTGHRGTGGALRLGKPVSPDWDIQFGPAAARVHDGGQRYRQVTVGIDALYVMSREDFRPFLLLGLGAEYDKAGMHGAEAQRTSPYINAGLGFQYGFDNQWGMQADVRRARSYLGGNDFSFDRASTTVLSLGLTYAFDKPRTPAPVARMVAPPEPVMMPARVAFATAPEAPTPQFERYSLSSTELFEFDSAELGVLQPKLDEIANALSHNQQIGEIVITGHTDRLGTAFYNQALSQRRAEAVKAYLVNRAVAADRLLAVGRGESQPVVDCRQQGRTELIHCLEGNRRVVIERIELERPSQ
ncbi:OmpA family protein [Chitinimonas viridis]|uniref:OmpA family protein n=1 Tax=Chitinimonas viridis TaxID=664880 RepID=A0ABT8B1T3_9NEIS|nr:OmpA family protein [Chitinimonas viridis]MDN3575503.1 OmpA family protein [Chitinimonas viridis]